MIYKAVSHNQQGNSNSSVKNSLGNTLKNICHTNTNEESIAAAIKGVTILFMRVELNKLSFTVTAGIEYLSGDWSGKVIDTNL